MEEVSLIEKEIEGFLEECELDSILNGNVIKFNWGHLTLDEAIANKGEIKVVKPTEDTLPQKKRED